MRWSSRAGRLPAEVRNTLSLGRGDHVLAQATTLGGSHAVATTGALYLPDGNGSLRRLPWETIGQASWHGGHLQVRILGGEEVTVGFADPGAVPEAVQERINATIVISRHLPLQAGGGVLIVGRRGLLAGRPTVRNAPDLHWSFVFDQGLDPADPDLLAEAEEHLENLRLQTGL